MRDLYTISEERASNKFELTGPPMDSYLRKLGKAMYSKLRRSRNTGLYATSKVICALHNISTLVCNVVSYGRSMHSCKSTISVTIDSFKTALKVFSPVRFGGQNYLKKRHFNKVKETNSPMLLYCGRASVVVGKSTPIMFDYNMKHERITLTFYVQQYNKEDVCLDLRLQALINK